MLNRRRLLFAGVATLPGVVLATSAKARKPKPKPKPKPKWKWKWETVTRTFSSNQLITIPHEGIATPYPAKIQVSGMRQGRIRKVTVSLSGLTHTWPRDLDIMLADPKGRGVILMNDAGVRTRSTLTSHSMTRHPPRCRKSRKPCCQENIGPPPTPPTMVNFLHPRPRAAEGRPWPCSTTATRTAPGRSTFSTTATPKTVRSRAGP